MGRWHRTRRYDDSHPVSGGASCKLDDVHRPSLPGYVPRHGPGLTTVAPALHISHSLTIGSVGTRTIRHPIHFFRVRVQCTKNDRRIGMAKLARVLNPWEFAVKPRRGSGLLEMSNVALPHGRFPCLSPCGERPQCGASREGMLHKGLEEGEWVRRAGSFRSASSLPSGANGIGSCFALQLVGHRSARCPVLCSQLGER
jgi:hypothetical protein